MAAAGGHDLEPLGHGSCRAVFRVVGRDLVLKVQFGSYAPRANEAEATLWRVLAKEPARKRIAPCRMLKSGVLVMRLTVWDPSNPTPEWAWPVDGGQGGMYRGRWVLYDYGHEMFRPDGGDEPGHERFRDKDWFQCA